MIDRRLLRGEASGSMGVEGREFEDEHSREGRAGTTEAEEETAVCAGELKASVSEASFRRTANFDILPLVSFFAFLCLGGEAGRRRLCA